MPFTKDDPYFTIGEIEKTIQEEPIEGEQGKFILGAIQEMITEIRRDVKNATIYARLVNNFVPGLKTFY